MVEIIRGKYYEKGYAKLVNWQQLQSYYCEDDGERAWRVLEPWIRARVNTGFMTAEAVVRLALAAGRWFADHNIGPLIRGQ